eukprot:779020-Amphidinium_carterae.1
MGAKAKMDKLAGNLKWGKASKLAKMCGSIYAVLQGVREVFFDPNVLYSKRSLDGIVQWPVTKDGRQGPKEQVAVQWTRDVDDAKAAGNPEWVSFKRQLIGTMLTNEGRCELETVQRLLLQLNEQLNKEEGDEVLVEALFTPGSSYDLSKALFWSQNTVCRFRPEAAQFRPGLEPVEEELRQALATLAKTLGSFPVDDLRDALRDAGIVVERLSDEVLQHALRNTPEVFYMPEMIFLSYTASLMVVSTPEVVETTKAGRKVNKGEAELEEGSSNSAFQDFMMSVEAIEAGEAFIASVKAAEDVAQGAPTAEAVGADVQQPVAATQADADKSTQPAGFFSFDEFAVQENALAWEKPAKRARLEENAAMAWEEEATLPAWVTEGAAVRIRAPDGVEETTRNIGVIIRAGVVACSVRSLVDAGKAGGLAGGGLMVEQEVATSRLLPLPPEVGNSVK